MSTTTTTTTRHPLTPGEALAAQLVLAGYHSLGCAVLRGLDDLAQEAARTELPPELADELELWLLSWGWEPEC